MDPYTHRFFSIPAKYAGKLVEDLELTVQKYGNNVVRIQLSNRLHIEQCRAQFKRILLIAGLAVVYFAIILKFDKEGTRITAAHILIPSLLWLAISSYLLRTALNLVQSEKVFYSRDIALQATTVRTFGRESTSICVEHGHIHDMVLNEVIENLDVKYMLILRTKGSVFRRTPIIPLFNRLHPSFECLEQIQQILHTYWLKNIPVSPKDAQSSDSPSLMAL
ncbi:CG14463 [Drosophila busckii]|uniref:CG14463 n=1 Tax=Drosophila busckii TaxID=30019 RepID=A0A0M3QY06_DROBS|nr:CG14463 [Drosophila busckii]